MLCFEDEDILVGENEQVGFALEHVNGEELLCFLFMLLGVVDEEHDHGIYLGVFENSDVIISQSIHLHPYIFTCLFLVVKNEIFCVLLLLGCLVGEVHKTYYGLYKNCRDALQQAHNRIRIRIVALNRPDLPSFIALLMSCSTTRSSPTLRSGRGSWCVGRDRHLCISPSICCSICSAQCNYCQQTV